MELPPLVISLATMPVGGLCNQINKSQITIYSWSYKSSLKTSLRWYFIPPYSLENHLCVNFFFNPYKYHFWYVVLSTIRVIRLRFLHSTATGKFILLLFFILYIQGLRNVFILWGKYKIFLWYCLLHVCQPYRCIISLDPMLILQQYTDHLSSAAHSFFFFFFHSWLLSLGRWWLVPIIVKMDRAFRFPPFMYKLPKMGIIHLHQLGEIWLCECVKSSFPRQPTLMCFHCGAVHRNMICDLGEFRSRPLRVDVLPMLMRFPSQILCTQSEFVTTSNEVGPIPHPVLNYQLERTSWGKRNFYPPISPHCYFPESISYFLTIFMESVFWEPGLEPDSLEENASLVVFL